MSPAGAAGGPRGRGLDGGQRAEVARALDQGGRPAGALQAYAQARKVLAEDLGADPAQTSSSCTAACWRSGPAPAAMTAAPPADAALPGAAAPPADAADAGLPGAGVPPAVLRQLPAMAAHFAGRAGELAALTGLLEKGFRQAVTCRARPRCCPRPMQPMAAMTLCGRLWSSTSASVPWTRHGWPTR
jgi:hypothetical protein